MRSLLTLTLLSLMTLMACADDLDPPVPPLPSSWRGEVRYSNANGTTRGEWFYAWTGSVKANLQISSNSSVDNHCSGGATMFGIPPEKGTSCALYASSEWGTVMVYPELSACCMCCPVSKGCGPVDPTWASSVNSSYLGQATIDGVDAVGWTIYGRQNDQMWFAEEEMAPLTPLRLVNGWDMTFDWFDVVEGMLSPSLFDLPPFCHLSSAPQCPGFCSHLV